MTRLRLLDDVAFDGVGLPAGRGPLLLALLAAAGSQPVSDDRLLGRLWSEEATPANPTKALQVVVSRVRSQTASEAVARTDRGYRLALPPEEVDALLLHAQLAVATRAELAGDAASAAAAARDALAWQVSDTGEGALGEVRADARRAQQQAGPLLGRALSTLGDHAEALPLLERAAGDDESTQVALMRSEAAVRGAAAALATYDGLRVDLADRLGVDPGPRLQALHAELLAADRPVREGLRFDATTLVGRDDDLRTLRALVAEHRVVSVLGPGGLGKTRLVNLLGRTAEQPQVHLVELVGVTDPADVVGEIGSALGVRDSVSGRRVLNAEQRADVRARIAQHLDAASTLLILDNCEHVVEAVADLVAYLVATCRRLHVVTTTRAPLAIGAEHVFPLGTLDDADAAALFVERARAARPGTRLVEEDVRRVVARLDGLPLAVELAAAKVRVMSVADVADRLDDRFALLRGSDRSAPDRHRTLLAVIDWSWALLAEPERRALRRLSLFPDGIALAAAESVLEDPGTLEVLENLLDQSLLSVVETDAGVRYRMLETVREFGMLQLAEAGETEAATEALRHWAVHLADQGWRSIWGPEQLTAVDRLHAEEGNLADVLRRALAEPDPATASRLLAALGALWTVRGDHPRVIALATAYDTAVTGWEPTEDLVDATVAAAVMVQTNTAVADAYRSQQASRLVRTLGDRVAHPVVAALVRVLGDFDARDLVSSTRRLESLYDDPDRRVVMMALQWSSHGLENAGRPERAVEVAERALALWSPEDGPWSRGQLLAQLTGLHAQLGDREAAVRRAHEVLPLLRRLGGHDDAVQVLSVVAVAALIEGDLVAAHRYAEEVQELARLAAGGLGSQIAVGPLLAELAIADGDPAHGLELYLAAVEQVRSLSFPGLGPATGLEPWTLFVEGAALVALARLAPADDPRTLRLRAGLVAKAPQVLGLEPRDADLPVSGVLLFALAVWEVLHGADDRADHAASSLALAAALGYPRWSPSLDWPRAAAECDTRWPGALDAAIVALGERRGSGLLDDARAVLT